MIKPAATSASPSTQRTLLLAVTAPVVIGLAILVLDRPLATWVHEHPWGHALWTGLTHIPDPLVALATLGLAGAGGAAVFGWRPGPRARILLACGLAVAIALMTKDQLKYVFGRTWPETWIDGNPSWIRDGVFLFQPFHGGRGWASFPSGHCALIAAPAAVLWQAAPAGRWLWAMLVVAVAVGLIGLNHHWLSDTLAGIGVGILSGLAARTLCRDTSGRPAP